MRYCVRFPNYVMKWENCIAFCDLFHSMKGEWNLYGFVCSVALIWYVFALLVYGMACKIQKGSCLSIQLSLKLSFFYSRKQKKVFFFLFPFCSSFATKRECRIAFVFKEQTTGNQKWIQRLKVKHWSSNSWRFLEGKHLRIL